MDQPADPATPLREVYQPFLGDLAMHLDLAMHGRKPAAIERSRCNIVCSEKWLDATEPPTILGSLEATMHFFGRPVTAL